MMPRSSAGEADRLNNESGYSVAGPSPMYGSHGGGNPGMARHPNHGYGAGGEGLRGPHLHPMGGHPSNPGGMELYQGARPSDRMSDHVHGGMGSNPMTPGGGAGGARFPGQPSQDTGSPVNTTGMGPGIGYGHMDGSMGHHGMMGNTGMYDMRGAPGMGNFGPGGMPGAEMDSRGLMGARRGGGGGRSGGGSSQGGAPGPSTATSSASAGQGGTSGGRGGISQAEREEELLLNLLIARRQRGRTGAGGEPSPALREELMRLRQQGGIEPGMGGGPPGGSMGGMPPGMYDPSSGMGGGGMMPGSTARATGAYVPGEGPDQRIERGPHYLMDARTQDMMAYGVPGGPGMGPGGNVSGVKRGPPAMPYDPSGFPGGNKMQYHGYGMMPQPHPSMGHAPQSMHVGHPGVIPMMGNVGMPPPSKKRRSHKKKPADMPRRPLSAYNLFFSEERERILKEIDGKGEEGKEKEEDNEKSKDEDNENGEAKVEKEEGSSEGASKEEKDKEKDDEGSKEGTKDDDPKSDGEKPKALLRPLIPNQKKRRPHRKTHGKISFQQLARMVGERWKALPEERRKYYQNLAQEDMKRQKEAMEDYYARQQAIKHGTTTLEKDDSGDDEPSAQGDMGVVVRAHTT